MGGGTDGSIGGGGVLMVLERESIFDEVIS